MRVMSQLLVHIRPGCGHRLWCALCLKVHLLTILPLYNQSLTLQGYCDPVLTSRESLLHNTHSSALPATTDG
jgi:hypothetical protein